MRTNGFQKPLNGMQITTWYLVPFLVSHFLMCITPTLPKQISIPLTILYVSFGIAALYFGYITTKTDSIDYKLYQHLHGSPHPKAADTTDVNETKYCWVCQTTVYAKSMHCKYCDKCVQHFDHHCMWLNTCIGEANYDTFFKAVVTVFFFTLTHILSLAIYLGLYFINDNAVRSLSKNWYNLDNPIILVCLNIGFITFTTLLAFMVVQLLVFHLGLRKEGITTYESIVQDAEKRRSKLMLSEKVKQRRVEELEKAGNSFQAMILKAGGTVCFGYRVCEPCDPVRKLVLQEAEQTEANERNRERNDANATNGEDDKFNDDDDEEFGSVLNGSISSRNGGSKAESTNTKRSDGKINLASNAGKGSSTSRSNGDAEPGTSMINNSCKISDSESKNFPKPVFLKVAKEAQYALEKKLSSKGNFESNKRRIVNRNIEVSQKVDDVTEKSLGSCLDDEDSYCVVNQ